MAQVGARQRRTKRGCLTYSLLAMQRLSSSSEIQREIQSLLERVEQLRALQASQKHLAFVRVHLQEHIDDLQARIAALLRN